MHILLTAATQLEIQPTIDFLNKSGPGNEKNTVRVLLTGVGQLATSYTLARHVILSRPDIALQAGIAGCFTGRNNGDLVAVKEEILADLGVWEDGGFRTLFDMKLAERGLSPFTNGSLINPSDDLLSATGLDTVRSISVNEISTLPDRIGWVQQNWSPVVESMEGGAFHYICIAENIRFLQIRAVSNRVGERDKTKWDFKTAIRNLNEKLISLLEEL